MSLPALLLSFVLASIYGVSFYLFFGKGWVQLLLYWVTALFGFAVGQLVSMLIGLSLLPIGAVNVIEATVTSLIALGLLRTFLRRSASAQAT